MIKDSQRLRAIEHTNPNLSGCRAVGQCQFQEADPQLHRWQPSWDLEVASRDYYKGLNPDATSSSLLRVQEKLEGLASCCSTEGGRVGR